MVRRVLFPMLVLVMVVTACAAEGAGEPSTVPGAATPTSATSPPTTAPDDGRCGFGEVPASGRITDPDDATGWTVGAPGDHGVDPAILEPGLDGLAPLPGLRSFLVARNGVLVVERYYHGARASDSREVASASKSIMSALVGIAIDRGHLAGVDAALGELLPEAFSGGRHTGREDLVLRSLLTMTTGFAFEPVIVQRRSLPEAVSVDAILSAPRSSSPGGFLYNTGATHLASAVLSRHTGMDTCTFAREALFDPLGITVDWWNRDRDGIHTGGWNLYLTARELARFGQLYLDGGRYRGRQIVPEEWIRESWVRRVFQVAGPVTDYGYWWWISDLGGHPVSSARGGGEQMIYVVPDLDLVVVTTSETDLPPGAERFDSLTFLWEHVLPAIDDPPDG